MEATEVTGTRRRMDRVTNAAIVVTTDAVLFLTIAVVGVPFLMFVFADETGTWDRLWPYVGVWVVAAVSGAACAAAAYGLARSGTRLARHGGAAAALGAAVMAPAVSLLLGSNLVIVWVSAAFAVANLIAAFVLYNIQEPSFAGFEPAPRPLEPSPPADAPDLADGDDPVTPDEAHELYQRPEPTTQAGAKPTIDLQLHPRPGTTRRRPRGQAALHTLGGIQLPPRARRTRPANRP
ncbi:hypothetical protein AB0J83_01005 [Actinoplanes sp. NPDC049596]|uniref:hypothetical protein n=1 Tax=unclassified Actinoplanes TaxID=2626549 RepID=UPI00342EADFF